MSLKNFFQWHTSNLSEDTSACPPDSTESSLEERGCGEKQKIHSLPPGRGRGSGIEANHSVSTKEVGKWIIIIAISTHPGKKIRTIKP